MSEKSVEDGVTNSTEAVEECLLAEDADMGEEEEDENMQELMGTNTHCDQGKQERSESKDEENAATNKELWGIEEDSGWYATSAKITALEVVICELLKTKFVISLQHEGIIVKILRNYIYRG